MAAWAHGYGEGPLPQRPAPAHIKGVEIYKRMALDEMCIMT